MQSILLCDHWTVRRLGQDARGEAFPARQVTIPHDAMLGEPRTGQSAGGTNTGWFEGGDYEYTRTLSIPAETVGQVLVLEFEGVYRDAEVFLNGEKIGARPYGYTNFYLDISCAVRHGRDNELRVVAHNADQPNSRWYSGTGLYRPVRLWTGGAQHILPGGIRVRTLQLNPATLDIQVLTEGDGPVTVRILEGDRCLVTAEGGATNGRAVLQAVLPQARLWAPGQGNLYTCEAEFAGDTDRTTFGVRTLEWGDQGLLLNGERVILRGACLHHDNGILGACAFPEAEERKVVLMQQNGYNAIRCAHNPCSKALLDACDRHGMLVMDEYADMWYIHKTPYDYAGQMPDWWKDDLREMVGKDYSHPSVILYCIGNEVSETAQERGIALTGEMTEYLHQLDPSRPVTCGVNIFFNLLSSIGFGVYDDKKAAREAERARQRQARGETVQRKAVGSEFFNNLAGLLGDNTMKLGATLPPCDWKTRDAFARLDVAGYNYGIYRYAHDLKKYPHRLILGTETFCRDAWRFWEQVQNNPRLLGDFVWTGMDYLGEVGLGAWEYKDYAPDFSHGPGWITSGCGRVDLIGTPLGEALYTRVVFEQEAGPLMAVVPVNHTRDKHSPSAWKMSNALPSWSWQGYEEAPATVEVYSRGATVELLLNDRPVARRKVSRTLCTVFHIPYQPGTLTAVSRDAQGRELGRHSLQTAGTSTELRLLPEQPAPRKSGLWFLRLRYTDDQGILKPLERGLIHVQVQGGRLVALGNGCPYNTRSYQTDMTDTYYGEALAVVRADPDAGTLTVTAQDDRHTATVSAQPVE